MNLPSIDVQSAKGPEEERRSERRPKAVSGRAKTQGPDPVTWLQEALRQGPRDSGELKKAAAEAGISAQKLYRYAEKAGVVQLPVPDPADPSRMRREKRWMLKEKDPAGA